MAQKARINAIECFMRSILTLGGNPQPDCRPRIPSSEMSVPFANPAKARMIACMIAESLSRAFAQLSTPLIADAALRVKLPFRITPPGIRPVTPNQRLAGPALPARHFGSVDVFLEAMQGAQPGDVLVIDN